MSEYYDEPGMFCAHKRARVEAAEARVELTEWLRGTGWKR